MRLEPIPLAGMMEINDDLDDLIEALDQRYGNPYMAKEYGLIQQAIIELRKLQSLKEKND